MLSIHFSVEKSILTGSTACCWCDITALLWPHHPPLQQQAESSGIIIGTVTYQSHCCNPNVILTWARWQSSPFHKTHPRNPLQIGSFAHTNQTSSPKGTYKAHSALSSTTSLSHSHTSLTPFCPPLRPFIGGACPYAPSSCHVFLLIGPDALKGDAAMWPAPSRLMAARPQDGARGVRRRGARAQLYPQHLKLEDLKVSKKTLSNNSEKTPKC